MFPQVVSTPLSAGKAAVARSPAAPAAPQPFHMAPRPSGRLAHWRASAFSMFADDQAQGPFSLWPQRDAAAKAPKKQAKQAKQAAITEDMLDAVPRKEKMQFRSALEQVSYYTNESAFQRKE